MTGGVPAVITDPALLAGRVALVSGGAMGMGASHAAALARCGAQVVVGDIDEAAAEETAARIGASAVACRLDVRRSDDWARAVARAEEAFGAVTVLVNNAGIVARTPMSEASEDDYRRVVEVNQVGPYLGMAAVLPGMRAARAGSIVNVSSTAGLVGFRDIIGYVASKWAVRGMTRAAAAEFAPWGIRVNCVVPGVIDTPMTSTLPHDGASLLGRRGLPDEVSNLVVFLASELSSYSTGGDFVVDGGETVVGAGG